MAGIARANIDWAATHTNGGQTHTTSIYVSGGGSNVFINGNSAVAKGDTTLCGELAIQGSGTVFVGGKPVHRLGDQLDSHAGTFSMSVCEQASTDVFAGG
jgi:uncharacterized Zn-binding protein involved in type VI secretion